MTAPSQALRSRWEPVAGLLGHARVGGPAPGVEGAPPVVLVHGLGVSSRYFVPLARELAASRLVAAVDLPGHGRSARPRGVPGIEALADALLGWLEALSLERPLLVANSVGCQVVVDLAARRPERAGPLVLVGPALEPGVAIPRQLARLALDAPREPLSLLATEAWDYLRTGPRRLLGTARASLGHPFRESLARVESRAVVVRGGGDRICQQGWAEEVARLLPAGELVVVPDAGHAVHWSRSRDVARLVEELE